MIPVIITEISISNFGFVVFLKGKQYNKLLPIFIGIPEAQAIAVHYNKLKSHRPLTHDLIKNILDLIDCKISKVLINDLIDNTFYARIFLQTKDDIFQMDSRPSDAIALALRFGVPIYVEEKVMEFGSIKVKDPREMEDISLNKSNELDFFQKELKKAVSEERYEDAAHIRDKIKKILDP